jgi:hypothetical protein
LQRVLAGEGIDFIFIFFSSSFPSYAAVFRQNLLEKVLFLLLFGYSDSITVFLFLLPACVSI